MVDRYYREIEDVENDIENAMQISSILLKLKGYDKKLEGLSKIDTNENDISSNLLKINNNSSTISTNFKQINRNTGNIANNSNEINTNTGNILNNLNQINTNTGNIANNLNQINTNTGDISNNLNQINTNTGNISNNLNQINTNTGDISTNLKKIDNFTQYILQSGKDFEEKYTIEKEIFKFDKDKHFYTMFEKEIEFDFTKNSLLFVKNHMYYKYENLSNDYFRLQHEYNIYDDENNLIHKYLFNKDTYYDESLDPILHTNEDFCICFKENYKKIKINLQLHRHNRHGVGNINLEIDDDNENYLNIDYVDRNNDGNNEQVDTNARDISTNLIKINSNEDDILYNLSEINNIKNNISKSYLKNVYNILFYNDKTQINFRDKIFYEQEFDVDASINDFIEMSFKISLQYENISERAYVKTIYELLDENDNSLYIKSVNNDDYKYYSNKMFIDESIFYNFNKNIKKIKFLIKFQMVLSRVIKIWYIKNNNYRLIIKNYGL